MKQIHRGTLFDLYAFEDRIHLWTIDSSGNSHIFYDFFRPVIYAKAEKSLLKKLVARLYELDAIDTPPVFEKRKLFYKNVFIDVLRIQIKRPSILHRIKNRLFAMYGKIDIYHSDFEIATSYLYHKNLHPLAKLEIHFDPATKNILKASTLDHIRDLDYSIPPLKICKISMKESHRLGVSEKNPLFVHFNNQTFELSPGSSPSEEKSFLHNLNHFLTGMDPDVILTQFGDQTILPFLFSLSHKHGIELQLDRDNRPAPGRKIITKGTSFNQYGSWIYSAPAYPLFGRWHIDATNSFVFKEAELSGVIELARISRIPVQKLSRGSTGTALTSIETDVALKMGYLVPWQKSAVEAPKTSYDLLRIDRGGLVFLPDIRRGYVHENVAQIDFAQMYPTIMHMHNISPETVNCSCCDPEVSPIVPGTYFHVCTKRRGVVSEALEHLLERRHYYKQAKKNPIYDTAEHYEARQSSLKWMLVTSFGYLGYRNAKFGRIESHESVSAYGREKLLTAKEIAESSGYRVLHAITDCLFVQRDPPPGAQNSVQKSLQESTNHPWKNSPAGDILSEKKLKPLLKKIYHSTGIEMGCDGIFSWVVFPPSKIQRGVSVVNRYLGRFQDGTMKYRGISARRKDTPPFIRDSQLQMLELMSFCSSVEELKKIHPQMVSLYQSFDRLLRKNQVSWKKLTFRHTTGKKLDEYRVNNAAKKTLEDLRELGVEVEPGEKIKYLMVRTHGKKGWKYISEEKFVNELNREMKPEIHTDRYRKMLKEAFEELWIYFAPRGFFSDRFSGGFLENAKPTSESQIPLFSDFQLHPMLIKNQPEKTDPRKSTHSTIRLLPYRDTSK